MKDESMTDAKILKMLSRLTEVIDHDIWKDMFLVSSEDDTELVEPKLIRDLLKSSADEEDDDRAGQLRYMVEIVREHMSGS